MSSPTIQNLVLQRGDDEDLLIWLFDSESEEPFDVGQVSEISFVIRQTWAGAQEDNSDALFVAEYPDDIVVADAASGTWLVTVPEETTIALGDAAAPYVYDVRVVTAAGKSVTTQKGYVQIGTDVARG